MNTIRIMVWGDGVLKTGFSRVATSILDRWTMYKYSDGAAVFEIHHVATNYAPMRIARHYAQMGYAAQGEEEARRLRVEASYKTYAVYETDSFAQLNFGGKIAEDVWGIQPFVELMNQIKPDVILLFNDIWLIAKILPMIQSNEWWLKSHPNILGYFPIDGYFMKTDVYPALSTLKASATFTKFGAKQLEQEAVVIGHGVDTNVFYPYAHKTGEPLSKRDSVSFARQALRELLDKETAAWFNEGKFILLQANRNQVRKMYHKTINGYVKFLKENQMPDDVGLLLLGSPDDFMGSDWRKIVAFCASYHGLPSQAVRERIKYVQTGNVTDAQMNMIYNATDVGINTAKGGGWELVNFEHAATNAAQILPNNSCFTEIWADKAYMMACAEEEIYENNTPVMFLRPLLSEVTRQITAAYRDFKHNYPEFERRCKLCYDEAVSHSWDDVARKLAEFVIKNAR